MPGNGWPEYQRLVLKGLDEQQEWLRSIERRITGIQVDIGQLKVKAGVWGLVGGLIPVVGALLILLLRVMMNGT